MAPKAPWRPCCHTHLSVKGYSATCEGHLIHYNGFKCGAVSFPKTPLLGKAFARRLAVACLAERWFPYSARCYAERLCENSFWAECRASELTVQMFCL